MCHLFHLNVIVVDLAQMAFANSITYFSLCGVPDMYSFRHRKTWQAKENIGKIIHDTFLCMTNFLEAINLIFLVLHHGQNKNVYLLMLVEPDLR